MKDFIRKRLNSTQIVIASFALVIVAGTFLLALPAATASGEPMDLVDAFFTAVSATCVTGLALVDTGSHFSVFGQLVILTCIQIGGLGLMTFTTVFVIFLGNRIAISDRLAVQESFHHTPTGNLRTLISYIVVATFSIELIGAALLVGIWTYQGRFPSFGETVYSALFHSVSAFCNAGFSLFAGSLTSFHDDPLTILAISFLIIAGGLGFLVLLDVKEFAQQKFLGWHWKEPVRQRVEDIRARPRLSMHSKFVLVTTTALLIIGAVSFFFLERNGLFEGMTSGTKWLNAWFCSVTARTAGFNAIDYSQMSGAALLCTMVLMFIGASPGSTGGGIKTSTFGLLVAYSIARGLGHSRLNAFGRSVPQISIDRAAAVVVSAVVLLILGSSVLMATETYYMSSKASQGSFLTITFETISALGTVGLSMGETGKLGTPGKIFISILMFLGRVGPLTLAIAISRPPKRGQFRYAEENIMVG